jgi:hypothetical protein
MPRVGKDPDASTCSLVSWTTGLSRDLQRGDGEMLNATPESVSTPIEMINEYFD